MFYIHHGLTVQRVVLGPTTYASRVQAFGTARMYPLSAHSTSPRTYPLTHSESGLIPSVLSLESAGYFVVLVVMLYSIEFVVLYSCWYC